MRRLIACLPVLILAAFPVLYVAGHCGSETGAFAGLLLLISGMSNSLLRRFANKQKNDK